MTEERFPATRHDVLWTSAKHCPQRWPKKDGVPYWRCKEPIVAMLDYPDGKSAAMCQKHLDWATA